MPDITMCLNKTCQHSAKCYRHEDSGTKPCEFRQPYATLAPREDGYCIHFIKASFMAE